MHKSLEFIAREANPLQDFERRPYLNYLTTRAHPSVNGLLLPKTFVRGGIVGGTIGSAISIIIGEHPQNGLVTGALAGIALDLGQYVLRSIYYNAKYSIELLYKQIKRSF